MSVSTLLVAANNVRAVEEKTMHHDIGYISDGEYTGSAMGNNGTIDLKVKIQAGKITDIVILSQHEDEPYWTSALSIIDRMVEEGKAEVDTISGATYSSGGIRDAVIDALNKQ